MLEWLIIKKVYDNVESIEFDKTMSKETKQSILRLLHKHRFPGAYQKDCFLNTCSVCRKERLWNLWNMDTMEFTKNVQWLPRNGRRYIGSYSLMTLKKLKPPAEACVYAFTSSDFTCDVYME